VDFVHGVMRARHQMPVLHHGHLSCRGSGRHGYDVCNLIISLWHN
jgi:hypothetical protein